MKFFQVMGETLSDVCGCYLCKICEKQFQCQSKSAATGF